MCLRCELWCLRRAPSGIRRDEGRPHSPPPLAAGAARVRCDLDDAARLAVLSLPTEPDVALEPADVVYAVCSGLQCNDVPEPDAGLARLFNFATYELPRGAAARQGKETVERFKKYADSPVMDAILYAPHPSTRTEPTVIAEVPARCAGHAGRHCRSRGARLRTSAGLERKPEDRAPTVRITSSRCSRNEGHRSPGAG